MNISETELSQILDARERRARVQRDMLAKTGLPLICFTMNMPGPVKRNPLSEFAFNRGLEMLAGRITPADSLITREPTGSEAFFAVDGEPGALKAIAVEIEESSPAGRLYDMDVIGPGGRLSREEPRRCIVCGGPAADCARSRAHGLTAVAGRAEALLRGFAADTLGDLAAEALIREVNVTPKPGLVDRRNSGAHRDMDLAAFLLSAEALRPYFKAAVRTGMDTAAAPHEAIMGTLRPLGAGAEEDMFRAAGANTHRGLVYSMGIMLCALGRGLVTGEKYLAAAARIAGADAESRLAAGRDRPVTHGDGAYARTGARGVRGEAAAGFPGAVLAAGLLKEYSRLGENDGGALALCRLMETTDDTNLIHRGGPDGLAYAKREAARINALPEGLRPSALCGLDGEFIRRGLSPGGCADLLALGLFLSRIEGLLAE